VTAGADASTEGSAISLPKGGGAVGGLGEKFCPDLFTGTGNFSVPVKVPAGRLGLQPQLSLGYSTGNGNGPFGLGWQLSVPGVSRKTSRGVPRYVDAAGAGEDRADVFVLSGAEDLVPVAGSYPGRVRYRPRTEGLFARIEHVRDDSGNYWEVRSTDGLFTRYGTPRPADADPTWQDAAAVSDPADPARVFGWRITQTQDPLGNLIRYDYRPDRGQDDGHTWDHPLLSRISYADYGDRANPAFLVTVDLDYEPRPDPFSDYRSGFELRTTQRCHTIRTTTHAADGIARVAREYRFAYDQATFNGVSLLATVDVVGIDDQGPPGQPAAEEQLPPLSFGYSGFDPAGRRFEPLTGPGLPTAALSDPTLALVDVRGVGLPDVVELGAAQRIWSNAGGGRFELPRQLAEAPPFSLGDPGVQFLDADGDGRPDLVVSELPAGGPAGGARGRIGGAVAGYFPMTFAAGWSRRSFQPYAQSPTVSLADPGVKLVDLDGDGLTDVLTSGSGSRLACWFNDADPRRAWRRTAVSNGTVPDLDLADPAVRLADMTGDGLQDLVLVRNGNLGYWPNLGHGRWGAMVTMRRSPRLPDGHDPRRVLLGDLDGDGAADLVYVDDGRVLLWGNQSGNAWTEQPVAITGTPNVVDTDAIQLSDLHGTGMAGLLFSRAADGSGRAHLRFLDLTGGVKPHLLVAMDNHLGALTRVTYRPSTAEYLRDQADPATRWRTTLPFTVQVVSQVEVVDAFSGGRLTTHYRYHHGYWDGLEREFRGFAMVEHLDSETFAQASAATPSAGSAVVPEVHYAPPTLTKSWFHPGPVAAVEAGDWTELDLSHEYWPGDPAMLTRPPELTTFLGGLTRTRRRAALRTLRGRLLRSELYARDGTDRQDRPYTVTEAVCGVREESPVGSATPEQPGAVRESIFFPFGLGQRTTQWERGDEPMTQFTFPAGYDAYGFATGQVAIAVPRRRDPRVADPAAGQPYLATHATTTYARRDDDAHYLVDRVCRSTSYEIVNDGTPAVVALRDAVLAGSTGGNGMSLRVIGHSRTFYDGEAFVGLTVGELGEHGLAVRAESLAFTDEFLDSLYAGGDPLTVGPRPAYLAPGPVTWPGEYPTEFGDLMPVLAGYRHYTDADVPGSPGGYYIAGARHRYDVHVPGQVPRGLPVESLDPLGASSRIGYDDPHDLLPVRAVDAAGLETLAVNDYRVLQPRELTDPNGNTTSVTFSSAGLVTARFLRGKGGEGDMTAPSVRMTYDLLAFTERRQPASVTSTRRVHHDTDAGVEADQRDDVIVSRGFSDGFGRVLQTRSQAEDTLFGDPVFGGGAIPADQLAPGGDTAGRTRGPAGPENVIVSGWQIYDNKGRVVQKYEPFFAVGFDYSEPVDTQLGQKATLFYDPRGQVIRTLNPDGSEQRVVLGVPVELGDPDGYAPTAWESYTYDANDNAGRTHPETSTAFQDHWNTPGSVEVDPLGRPVVAVARNAVTDHDGAWFATRSTYDIQGNLVSITDAQGREAFRYRFDLAKRRWRMDSIDAGRRDTVPDALGNPVEGRDSKGAFTIGAFDVLHRPIRVWARDNGADPVTLRQRIDYGDAGDPLQHADERATARALNLLGRPVANYDEAGLVTTAAVDFKGNLLESSRRVIADAPILATYEAARTNGWRVTPFQVDWTPRPGRTQADRDTELLEAAGYATTTSYDALNRVNRHVLPSDAEGRRRELHPTYNRAGGLEQVRLDEAVFVQRIAYTAKGQRSLIAYGNGVMTRYAYHPQTFRLARLRSEHYIPDDTTYRPGGEVLQDYGYDYDLAENILGIHDRTPGSGIPNNPSAMLTTDPRLRALLGSGDALDRTFTYDPTYRLLTATGREHQTPPGGDPWIDLPRGTDVTQAQAYVETYHYDPLGSMLELTHASTGGFSRHFTVEAGTNRLQRMTIGTTPCDYTFDANGNMTAETSSRHFDWNHADQLTAFATQTPGAEPSIHVHYLYDAAGQRVKKLVRRQGGSVEVTHYLDEVVEHHRWTGSATGENTLVHVMDDTQRVAVVRVGPAHPDDRGPAIALHLADHLGSSTAILDATGVLSNREEFTPYGETSFGSFTRKRYRFTGKERDEESGLNYHGARYLCCWTGRFGSVDPHQDRYPQCSPYCYAAGNPVRVIDPNGSDPVDVQPNIDAINALSAEAEQASQNLALARQAFEQLPKTAPPTGRSSDLIRFATDKNFRKSLNASQALQDAQAAAENVERRLRGAEHFLRTDADVESIRARSVELESLYRDPLLHTPESVAVQEAQLRVGNAADRIRGALAEGSQTPVRGRPVPWTKRIFSPGGGAGGPTIVNESEAPHSPGIESPPNPAIEGPRLSMLGKIGRMASFMAKASIAVSVVRRSFLMGYYIREGRGWEAAKQPFLWIEDQFDLIRLLM
jgi:RHS repeat-associated protein